MIKFATTQRSYRYNNHIEDEEAYIIKEYKDSLTVEQLKQMMIWNCK